MSKIKDRIVVLIDMDCFFCQVEAKLNPALQGKPLAVVQYGSFGPSSIIAVNYEARDHGVTRHMKGPEAKEKCHDIILVTVPPIRNKPDTSRYRKAGREVIDVLKQYCNIIERASIDEAYLDITDIVDEKLNTTDTTSLNSIIDKLSNSFVVGYCDDNSNDEIKRSEGTKKWIEAAFDEMGDEQARKLTIAGLIVEELREQIWKQCQYRCSAGISYNKILAKLACGIHKPNRQTILPLSAVPGLYSSLPVKKVRNLGGKFGNIVMESLGCNVMADLLRFSLQDLQKRFDEKTGLWLWNIARGTDNEPVQNRLICKSIGASKNFPGKQAITKLETLKQWVGDIAAELVDRLEQDKEENERRAVTMTVGYHYYNDGKIVATTKVVPLTNYKIDKISNLCIDVITKATQKPITLISMSAGKFVPSKGSNDFLNYFKNGVNVKPQDQESNDTQNHIKQNNIDVKNSTDKIEEKIDSIDELSNDSNDFSVNYKNESTIKTYEKKEQQKKPSIVKNSICELSFNKKIKDSNSIDVKVCDKKSSLIAVNNLAKPLDSESFKNSFFMNILKDSNPEFLIPPVPSTSNLKLDLPNEQQENLNTDASPDLFDDCTLEDGEINKSIFFNEDNNEDQAVVNSEIEEKKETALDQLKEIFPDLDNIDPAVVKLLPLELQEVAKVYLKNKSSSATIVINENNTKTLSKEKITITKEKLTNNTKNLTKEKTSKLKNCKIPQFFSKKTSNINSEMKKCDDCLKMIEVDRWLEHCDFHVAQNLQKLMNQNENNAGPSRPIKITDKTKSPSIKRKINSGISPPNKKPRGIAAFLQQ
ncbi:DNApol-eta-like [Aphidius gifuensis]|uniref:DNApol-eta-like n=1 Tax=Aphidius gifuensis TaxID=684658 RepID=UPI001CDC8BD8|nr:DNApol-eta-like [Aphidius gifuensis]